MSLSAFNKTVRKLQEVQCPRQGLELINDLLEMDVEVCKITRIPELRTSYRDNIELLFHIRNGHPFPGDLDAIKQSMPGLLEILNQSSVNSDR